MTLVYICIFWQTIFTIAEIVAVIKKKSFITVMSLLFISLFFGVIGFVMTLAQE